MWITQIVIVVSEKTPYLFDSSQWHSPTAIFIKSYETRRLLQYAEKNRDYEEKFKFWWSIVVGEIYDHHSDHLEE